MERLHQDILIELRERILDDMDVRNGVLPVLLAKYILNQEDARYIESGIHLREKAEILLDILPKRGSNAFNAFRDSLRHHYKWLSDDMDDLELKKTGRNSVESLIFPPTSPLTINRNDKMKQLIEALKNLKPNRYLILHGMKGFGRSCLTSSVLNDIKLTEDFFHNKIYWLKFGYDKRCRYKHDDKHDYEQFIYEEITRQLNGLYSCITNKELLNESLKSELFKIFLSNHFSKEENRNALLVLEDVYDKNFIEAFDFKCKTLVITTDLEVLNGRKDTVIQMNDGFTEAETLGLFAKVLETSVDKLPLEAKLIHKECKGMPLLIAMFSANFEEFKDDMNKHKRRWQYYLRCIQNKDTNNTIINKLFEKQEAVFNMSIERLPPHLKTLYEQLAIFSEDVNITPMTLEILWSRQLFEVEEIMLELCHKSLAAMRWNANLECYIYGVHDLLLCHLRRKLGIDKLTEMHKLFIENYRKYCNNDFSNLPNDNYSYSYIGHHLELAKLYDQFPILYLDFNFLEAKLNHTGLCDLLIDFNKYKQYIRINDYESNRANDIEKFLQDKANNISKHRRKKCLDLIQIAMNHFNPGYVAKTATHIAEKRINNLYLSQDTKLQQNNIRESEEVCTETYTTCFTDDPNVILIGNKMGEIIQWHSEHKKQIVYKAYGKANIIEKIVVSRDGESFLTLCNGIAELFTLYSNDYYNKLDINIQSPKQKQTFWSNIYSNDGNYSLKQFSIENETITDVTFGHNDERIAACTKEGAIQVWDKNGRILAINHQKNKSFGYIAFTTESRLLHTMDVLNGVIVTYTKDNDNYSYGSQYNLQLLRKKVIFFHDIPKHDNSLIVITENKAIHVKWFCQSTEKIHNYEKKSKAENDRTVYVCASITYDGLYLILADSVGLVNIWKIHGGFHPIAVYKSRVASLDTYWLKDEGFHYICGNENNLVHKWKFPVEEASDTRVRNLLFDALVKPLEEVDLIAKTTNANSVEILCGDNIVAESSAIDGDIISLKFSPNGKRLVYITKQGIVKLVDINDKTTINISKTTEDSRFIKFLTIEDYEVIISREMYNHLRVWKNTKIAYLIETPGYIISIHNLYNEYVIAVTKNGVITLYNTSGTKWTIISRAVVESNNINIFFSCFSHKKQFLALLNNNQDLFLYNLQENQNTVPSCIIIGLYYNESFKEQPTYCDISQDQKYLAIGFKTGSITIIDIEEKKLMRKLEFHTSAITQLNWAPVTIKIPLLLSLNEDEIAWWNIHLIYHSAQQKRPSRHGLERSFSTPFNTNSDSLTFNNDDIDISSIKLSNSSTEILETYEEFDNIENLPPYWKRKVGRNRKKPELLGALELPPSCIPKLCISADFSKFVTVDIYGSVSTFKLFNYSNVK